MSDQKAQVARDGPRGTFQLFHSILPLELLPSINRRVRPIGKMAFALMVDSVSLRYNFGL